MNTKLFLIPLFLTALIPQISASVFAQQQELPIQEESEPTAPTSTLITGKVIIPITATEQIIIDLPIKPDSKIEIVPIQ
jgi:hypothetical protein